jgi:hypothetical protein
MCKQYLFLINTKQTTVNENKCNLVSYLNSASQLIQINLIYYNIYTV